MNNENILRPQEGFQQKFLSSQADIVIGGGAAGAGKALSLDSQVLMADGRFDYIHNVRIGDCIIGDDGEEAMIIDLTKHKDLVMYSVEFTDSTTVDACEDHLWRVKKKGNDYYEVLSTKFLKHSTDIKKQGCYQFEVPLVEPVALKKQDLPLDPYLMGVFLGDGHFTKNGTVSLSVGFNELEGLKKHLPRWSTLYDKGTCYKIVFKQFKSIIIGMGLNGMVRDNKFIPQEFLLSSIEDRLELLRGLMDTDGTVSTRLSGNTATSFCNQNKNLIEGVIQLVQSLGGVASVYHYVNKNNNRNEYYVNIRMTLNPFKLQRKAEVFKSVNPKKKIRSITRINNQPGVCIGVNNPNHCFVTNGYTVTHNSFALLLEIARLMDVDNATGVIFRQTKPQLKVGGGLWDTASQLYGAWAKMNNTNLEMVFPKTKAKIKFSHLEYEKDVFAHDGSQYAFIGFDEVQHFSWNQFRYLLSRNRTMTSIKPYVRCTCNPRAGIWLKDFVEWWIGADGYPVQDRDGVLRYMYMKGEKVSDIIWGDTKQEVIDKADGLLQEIADNFDINTEDLIKSVTFIAGSLEDNRKLLTNDPSYVGKLLAQDEENKARLLYGNWNDFSDDAQRLFSNLDGIFTPIPLVDKTGIYYISVDVATTGKDLAVIMLWRGFEVVGMQIFTKCEGEDIYDAVELYRAHFNVASNRVIVDKDGVGSSLPSRGRYIGLFNNGRPLVGKNETMNYNHTKSQLYYLAAKVINNHENTGFRINLDQVYLDGVKLSPRSAKIKGQLISDRILEELMVYTRDYTIGKKKINTKEEIKKKLGRSPDFADAIAYRMYFAVNQTIPGFLSLPK